VAPRAAAAQLCLEKLMLSLPPRRGVSMTGRYGKRAGRPDTTGPQSVRRTVGSATGATLALVLLVCGCVFAAIAGPALSVHTRSQALHQTLAGLASSVKTVQVSGSWGEFTTTLQAAGALPGHNLLLPGSTVGESMDQLTTGFRGAGLPLAAGRWFGLNSNPRPMSGAKPENNAGAPPRLEVTYRDALPGNAQLVAGSYTITKVPAGTLPVTATTQTAALFGLHPGSRMVVAGSSGPLKLLVTAIVRQRQSGSAFWTQDPTVGVPSLTTPPRGLPPPYTDIPYWVAGVFADPGQFTTMQVMFSGAGMEMTWEFPLNLNGVGAEQAQSLYDKLNRVTSDAPLLSEDLAKGTSILSVTAAPLPDLQAFLGTQAAIETVLLLLFVSLIVTGAAVILLAARMIVLRRSAELTLLRARGGSLRQIAALMARAAVIAVVPATLIGAGLAVLLLPGDLASSALGWSLAAITVLAAVAGPPLIAAWQHRRAAPAANPARITGTETGRPRIAWRRPVAEVTACAAAVGALVVLHDQGLPPAGGTDLYLAATPVLLAVPVVLLMLRLYPLVMRCLLAVSARSAGATGFVALSRAARSSLTGVLPAFGLVLALSLATFAGMVNSGIDRGEATASWQDNGADVAIRPGPSGAPISSAAVRAIAAVHGVQAVTAVWNTSWTVPDGEPLQVSAVEPASYAAVVAGTPFPALPVQLGAGKAASTRGAATAGPLVSVIASPQAASLLGTGTTQLDSQLAMGPIDVRVAGVVSSTPAQPGGGVLVIMPVQTLPGPAGQPAPNLVLVTGSGIDNAQLTAVANKLIPGNATTFRSTLLAALAGSPLQHGALLITVLTIATAAAFGLFIVLLGLALGAAERELTLARLTVMGHQRPTGLVLAEAMPAVLAAALAGGVCAVLLPHLIGSAINLSAFTGTGAPVEFSPNLVTVGLPVLATCVLAAATLATEARALRRRGATGLLRAS
jgi:putative ABC transport system permease protein